MQRSYGGGPPFLKLGRTWYFKQDLDEWIKARRVTTTAELYAKQRTGEVSKRAVKVRPVGPHRGPRKKKQEQAGKNARRVASKGTRPLQVEG